MDRNLALEFVRVTEAAAISAAEWIGRGDKHAADQAAVDAMRSRLNQVDFSGTVVIGEGKKDEAPMLFTGEKVGKAKSPVMDLAVDPLECTDSVAHGRYNAISVIAAGSTNSLLHAPDTYMEKLAVGPAAKNVIDLNAPVKDTIKKVAKALGKDVREITVLTLDRDRHNQLISDVRRVGARVRLITDGDVAGAIAPSLPDADIDILMGIGASAEAVLAATAIKILGGEILARFKPLKEKHLAEIKQAGIKNIKKVYTSDNLAKGRQLTFTATGVIEGPLLKGVEFQANTIVTHSMVIRGISGTVRYITTHHHYRRM
ncbi:fructose-bisphosphatase, class II [Candidatus Roizmanbacteria bacterium RIFCSPHIGHO2_02_FULL_37_15]|uniref:Fructose-1,6-bisphosphatase n=1 Tax=Candidatus Roizmanbacteria bacterium RIFCSPLOWO2_01_FULL_37_16 TaxID=1802058 RepID=A0A1F7INJ6_9BACT|nr:MAG: fructose-bisphosphatase, class II [Candidatus Roizmanbacteria bacterium RIFCSPHIGHO2_01_FULL_37_16b]OGK21436.1 MAG: fructose-bisphosphatase, class II [Candidatus Roizmanbacteria bacterium RIFCSPHIGHO2_02_FULL_37_15]OGK32408.1 MAG: fructose-bisphosphatase, class II [Candidatus Roizmanbacteria bacterium RIFCSPHIGHO2_12_FULL_36_11]OGK44953.1 MAG: fructose-bisphosphatase, class II [Candidatus Roizmanbacteria bacterium RIFCSPLOWO2_01_FULL_37_16]